jgi:hypothetical protein
VYISNSTCSSSGSGCSGVGVIDRARVFFVSRDGEDVSNNVKGKVNLFELGGSFPSSFSMVNSRFCWVRIGVVSRGRFERRYDAADLVGDQLNRFVLGISFSGSIGDLRSCVSTGVVSRGRSERRYEAVDLVGDQLNRFLVGDFGGSLSFSVIGSSSGEIGERGFVSRGLLNTPK